MSYTTILVMLAVAIASIATVAFTARLMQYRHASRPEDSDTFQLARYAPMARLLDPAEATFLAAQPGVDAQAVARFQKDRRQIFRMYLKEVSADFRQLHAEARQIIAASPEPNSALVESLVSIQFRFWAALALVEIELALADFGFGNANPGRLLNVVESLSNTLVQTTTVPGPVPVR